MSDDPNPPSDLVIGWEKVGRARADGLDDLLAAHWAEVALDQDRYPLAPDWPRYHALERQGVLRSVSARRKGRLVGYNVFFVQPPIHYSTSVWALNDVLFLHPDHRAGLLGYRLVRAAEELLKGIGVARVIYHTKLHVMLGSKRERPLGDLMKRLGYSQAEEVWGKNL